MSRYAGLNTHRLPDNSEEARFAAAWKAEHGPGRGHGLLPYLLGDGNTAGVVSKRDEVVAATVVQWLGSPVGQGFLVKLGWQLERKAPTAKRKPKRKPGDPRTPVEQRKVDAMWQHCPYCGMEPGTYCITEWGTTVYTPHKARYDVVDGKL